RRMVVIFILTFTFFWGSRLWLFSCPLKEDDDVCAEALQHAQIFLFHRLSPLLQRTWWGTCCKHTEHIRAILERLGSDEAKLKESVLIGCSEQNQVQFCLDVGKPSWELVNWSPLAFLGLRLVCRRTGPGVALEEALDGTFVDLKKGFFDLRRSEAPLLAKAQALLRWHLTTGFCSATGRPTCPNQAGSQRVGGGGGTIYYPPGRSMSPVVIVLVSDGKRCLLGRQPSFPPRDVKGLWSRGHAPPPMAAPQTRHRKPPHHRVGGASAMQPEGGLVQMVLPHWPLRVLSQ
uniref:Nudix (nucleoside diphosphate linked moiety X)-type motif 13 n=1 Tax=Takifugu rubripes TaxID=31033 RepID=A0A674MUA3_TAKRU